MGGMLKAMPKNKGGDRTHKKHRSQNDTSATLADLGIKKMTSHRLQTMNELTDEERIAICARIAAKKEITSTAIYQAGRTKRAKNRPAVSAVFSCCFQML